MSLKEFKICSVCNKEKSLAEYYQQKKTRKDGSQWIYCNPECKECTKERSMIWQIKNPEKYGENVKRQNSRIERKNAKKKDNERRKNEGKYTEWRRNNPLKVKEYALKYNANKQHNISKEEWKACKQYFNNCCAYCGISEEDAKEHQGQRLHKEHAVNKGANDISNCVPSCRSCNSYKGSFDFNEWYTPENERYEKNKLNKIIQWLEVGYKEYLNSTI